MRVTLMTRVDRDRLALLAVGAIGVLLHSAWFSSTEVTYGGWGFHHLESVREWFPIPVVWSNATGLSIYDVLGLALRAFMAAFGLLAST
ncbi:hypothetical protein HKBW3S25_02001, partial [Candidatus Hakubella thermalkaliphila]